MPSSNARHLTLQEDALKSPLKSPRPLGLFIHKDSSRVSVNEMHPQPPHTPSGLRAQLGQLMPRHAYFRAKVHIHQISSVPFVSGEFGVRWKFKGVHTPHPSTKTGLLQQFKARTEKKVTLDDKGKGREDDKGKGREDDSESGLHKDLHEILSPGVAVDGGHVSMQRSASGRPGVDKSGVNPRTMNASVPKMAHSSSVSSCASDLSHSQTLSVDWTISSSSSNLNSLSANASSNGSHVTLLASPTTNLAADVPDPNPLLSPNVAADSSTPARGMTPFLKLKDHSVVWNATLDTILKFDIERESSQVLANPLKLVVMQRVIPDDPNGPPQNPRLGAVYLNLAEYIDKGAVERRYLLKESKTNATLKLTIEMEFAYGETNYVAPPLAKGEIMTGIANFLDNHGAMKKRPRGLDLYGPYRDQEELEIDLLGVAKSARVPKTARSERRPSDSTNPTESETDEDTEEGGLADSMVEELEVAFDVQRLPLAYGTKTTETLIEAIFNPVKISDQRKESPFTMYEPLHSPPMSGKTVKGVPPSIGLGLAGVAYDRNATIGRRQGSLTSEDVASVYDTTSSSASVRTTTSNSSKSPSKDSRPASEAHAAGFTSQNTPLGRVVVTAEQTPLGGVRAWWKRHTTSRPGTPTTRS